MAPPTNPDPPGARLHDPSAVAFGNASLLGIGYLMLGRRRLALVTGAVTFVLLCALGLVARTWCEVVVALWWAGLIAHGWFLAGGRGPRVTSRRRRQVAGGAAVAVLLALGLLRLDASRVGRSVTDAREKGDCAQVTKSRHGLWPARRVAAAPKTAESDRAVGTCHRLRTARTKLTAGLAGDTRALKAGFDTLSEVLAEPGNGRVTDVVLNGFLGKLPTKDACRTAAISDWLRQRRPGHNALDRSAETAARIAPAALIGCGDARLAAQDWHRARARYQQVLDQYPGYEGADRARNGIRRATPHIELENVRRLLPEPNDYFTIRDPAYCSRPAKYSGAAPYGGGINRALFYGADKYTDKLPERWRTRHVSQAVLVVCAGKAKKGPTVRTCSYGELIDFPDTDVRFHKVAIPVKVYELRTGKVVAKRTVEIDGASCPETLKYTTPAWSDYGPDEDQLVKPSKSDIRDAFSSLIDR